MYSLSPCCVAARSLVVLPHTVLPLSVLTLAVLLILRLHTVVPLAGHSANGKAHYTSTVHSAASL